MGACIKGRRGERGRQRKREVLITLTLLHPTACIPTRLTYLVWASVRGEVFFTNYTLNMCSVNWTMNSSSAHTGSQWGSHDHKRGVTWVQGRSHMTTRVVTWPQVRVTWPQERVTWPQETVTWPQERSHDHRRGLHDYKKGSQRAINELQVLTTCRAGESGGMLPRKHWNWNSQFEEIANFILAIIKVHNVLVKTCMHS